MLTNSSGAVEALNVGEHLTDTFTVTTVDGTQQIVTVTIDGTNDAAIISGTSSGTVVEAGGVANAIGGTPTVRDRKSTRLNSSHSQISYAVFCLKTKNNDYDSY